MFAMQTHSECESGSGLASLTAEGGERGEAGRGGSIAGGPLPPSYTFPA